MRWNVEYLLNNPRGKAQVRRIVVRAGCAVTAINQAGVALKMMHNDIETFVVGIRAINEKDLHQTLPLKSRDAGYPSGSYLHVADEIGWDRAPEEGELRKSKVMLPGHWFRDETGKSILCSYTGYRKFQEGGWYDEYIDYRTGDKYYARKERSA